MPDCPVHSPGLTADGERPQSPADDGPPDPAAMMLNPGRKCKCTVHTAGDSFHGTPSGRQHHKCECRRCTTGTKAYHQDYYRDVTAPAAAREERLCEGPGCDQPLSPSQRKYHSRECREAVHEQRLADEPGYREKWNRSASHDRNVERRIAFLEEQGGRCRLCGGLLEFADAVLDHNHDCCDKGPRHACGECYRGAVHGECNFLLGYAKDSIELLELAIAYLEAPWVIGPRIPSRQILDLQAVRAGLCGRPDCGARRPVPRIPALGRYCSRTCQNVVKTAAMQARLNKRRADLLARQSGTCALCREPLALAVAEVDHDHSHCRTKKARAACGGCDRGALHRNCNSVLAKAGESVTRLRQAIRYLDPGADGADWRSQVR